MTQTATKEATAVLSAHSGAVKVSREELALIQTPPRTTSFTPVPHIEVVNLIEKRLAVHKMVIRTEEFAIQSNGMKLFGTLVLKHQTRDDFSFAIGLRTSNDKTMAAQMVAGSRVFVCDNMVFSGELITWRKHTGSLDIRAELFDGVDNAIAKFAIMDSRISALKGTALADVEAKALIYDAINTGVMPLNYASKVGKNYFEPPHTEFEGRNLWSLHNAFTEAFKELRPNVAMESAIELGKMFTL